MSPTLSRGLAWGRWVVGLVAAVAGPPAALVITSRSVPVHLEWWMFAIGAAGILVLPVSLRARLLWLLPYLALLWVMLIMVALTHACSLGACV